MKKTLSLLLTVIMLISCMSGAFYAEAQEGNYAQTDLSAYIDKEIKAAATALYSDTAFGVGNANNFILYLRSGCNISDDVKTAFVSDVMGNLDANDGRICSYGSEDLGVYGSVIVALRELGYKTDDFYGYDIDAAFTKLSPDSIYNPYLYSYAIEAADDEYAVSLCEQYINDKYTIGSGMDYWGFSCDNTAKLIEAISPYSESFSEVITDAVEVVLSHRVDGGAFFNADYGTEPNSNSTAMSLLAMSCVGDLDNAWGYYKALITNYQSGTGLFTYDGEYSTFSTNDALAALEKYAELVKLNGYEHPEEITTTTTTKATTSKNGAITTKCTICGKKTVKTINAVKSVTLSSSTYTYSGKVIKPSVTVKDSSGKKLSSGNYSVAYSNNKNVGSATVKITLKGNYSGTVTKTFKINPKSTSISKIKSTKKGFKINWKKQATQTTGYQIRYSLKSNMSGAKTVTVSKNGTTSKTVSKLKGRKKYYIQVRTYKTVNGKKYYSAWSAKKSVTTKK